MSHERPPLGETIAHIQRRWGPRALRRAGELAACGPPVWPSGFPELDRALGRGGLPRGRLSELIGWGTAGMTSVAARVLAQAQRAGDQVAYLDADAALDVECLLRAGVSPEGLLVLRPRDYGHALQLTRDLLHAGGVGALLFDRLRVSTLLRDGEARDATERALRDWTPLLERSLCALLLISETPPPQYPPGLAVAHYASLRLEFARQEWLTHGPRIVGYATRATVRKNKLGPWGQSVVLQIPIGEEG